MGTLDSLVDEKKRIDIMTGCACHYPESDLQKIRKIYKETKDIDLVHQMLQEQFISFLKTSLRLHDELIEDIVGRGWGLAGIKKGTTIIATKIPESGDLVQYVRESDPEKNGHSTVIAPESEKQYNLEHLFPHLLLLRSRILQENMGVYTAAACEGRRCRISAPGR